MKLLLIIALAVTARAEGPHGTGGAEPKRETVTTPAATTDPVRLIDSEMERVWKENKLTPSKPSTDFEFLRRATLDILGRTPTLNEIQSFLREPADKRRENLCDRLVDDVEIAPYWAKRWQDWLLETTEDNPNPDRGKPLYRFLERKLADRNVGWDAVVKELLASESRDRGQPNLINEAADFLRSSTGEAVRNERFGQYDWVPATNRTSRLFLGHRVQCAQCHDHPNDPRFTQARYWELNAFFRQAGFGQEGFHDIPSLNSQGFIYYDTRSGMSKPAFPRFLDGRRWDPKSGQSRREALAGFVTSSEYFPKAFLNRLWAQFFGKGLNAPNAVDDFSDEEFAFKKLLDGLGDHFKHSGFKMREAMRWICKSKSYGLSSVRHGSVPEGENLFSYMTMRPMNPEQLTESLIVALNIDPKVLPRDKLFETLFTEVTKKPDTAGEDRSGKSDIQRALAVQNSEEINKAITSFVAKSHGSDLDRSIRGYYLSILNRPPTAAEVHHIKKEVKDTAGLEDLVSALIMSGEFQLNH